MTTLDGVTGGEPGAVRQRKTSRQQCYMDGRTQAIQNGGMVIKLRGAAPVAVVAQKAQRWWAVGSSSWDCGLHRCEAGW